MLNPVKVLLDTPTGHVAAIGILSTYFESIEVYKTGADSNRKSKKFFTQCFCEIFGTKDDSYSKDAMTDVANAFYSQGRCGFAHDGLFKNRLFFSNVNQDALILTYPRTDGKVDTTKPVQSIVVNPFRFAKLVFDHFEQYMSQLRDPHATEVRGRFLQAVAIKWGEENEEARIALTQDEFLANKW